MKQLIIILALSLFFGELTFAQDVVKETKEVINYTDINGLKQGKWKKPYKSGRLAYEATFKNDKLIGLYQRFYPSGKLMIEVNYDEKEAGPVTLFYDNGEISARGFYVNRKVRDSVWYLYDANRYRLSEIHYKNGVLHGKQIVYWKNGIKCQEKDWVNGKEEGVWQERFENGNDRLKARMINNKRNGLFSVYYPSGRYYLKGHYKNNIREGLWIYYEENGDVKKELHYINGHAENEDEIDRKITKEILEWDEVKGKIPDPNIENMMHYEKDYRQFSK